MRNQKVINYYRREVYGNVREYVVDQGDAKIIQGLTGQKTIDGRIRELLRDLTNGMVSFNLVTV